MTGYDEAVAWFRADPGRVRDLDDVDNRSAAIAIVNAALAEAVPAGRDLTANDVRNAHHAAWGVPNGEPFRQSVADFLNAVGSSEPRLTSTTAAWMAEWLIDHGWAPVPVDDEADGITAEQYRHIYDDLIRGLAVDLGLDPEKAGGGSVTAAVRRLVAGVSVPQKSTESTADSLLDAGFAVASVLDTALADVPMPAEMEQDAIRVLTAWRVATDRPAAAGDTAAPDVQVWQSDDGDWGWACTRCDYRSVPWWSDRDVAERAAVEHERDRCPAGGSAPASMDGDQR